MKLIYLDIDGVVTCASSIIFFNRLNQLGITNKPSLESLCPICTSNLEYILEEVPDVQIVISSTHRKYQTIDELKDMFNSSTISDRIIDVTPILPSRYRGDEIKESLKKYPNAKFVILDDNSDMKPYMKNLVQTDSKNGLSFTDAEKAIKMLDTPTGEKSEKD